MTTLLRTMTADDWEAWRAVRLEALAESPGAFGSTHADWVGAEEPRWRGRLSIPGAIDVVAFEGDTAIGMASGVPAETPGRAELISMWVAPAARGRGVARTVITAIAGWAVRSGFDVLALTVMPDNDGARTAYERNGFVRAHEPGPVLPDGRHEIAMTRDLRAERTLDTYERESQRYVDRTSDARSGLVEDVLAVVPVGSTVLEVGSGPGRDALALEAAGLRVVRSDGARAFVERLRDQGHEALVLDVLRDDLGGPYDAVFANAVLLHVPRERLVDVLGRIRAAVRPGGVLAATLKRGEGEAWTTAKLDAPRHVTYWTERALADAVDAAGWGSAEVRDSTVPGAAERWLTVVARRGTS
ncbi:MAG: GNAT family N-acetyltransferase [Williamsia herbipolensis]|nr:GNAT family N-acetyltransferase [Williamsia herbipolensis]